MIHRVSALCFPAWMFVVTFCVFLATPMWGLILGTFLVCRIFGTTNKGTISSTHGSAAWATLPELEQAGCVFRNSGVQLGQLVNLPPSTAVHEYRALFTYPLRKSEDAVVIASWRRGRGRPVPVYLPSYSRTAQSSDLPAGEKQRATPSRCCFKIPAISLCLIRKGSWQDSRPCSDIRSSKTRLWSSIHSALRMAAALRQQGSTRSIFIVAMTTP